MLALTLAVAHDNIMLSGACSDASSVEWRSRRVLETRVRYTDRHHTALTEG